MSPPPPVAGPNRHGAAAPVRRQAWQLRAQAARAARRARKQLVVLIPLVVVIATAYRYRVELFGVDKPIRLATAGALVVVGWALARSLGRAMQPRLMRRLEPGTAAMTGFLIRLVTLAAILLASLRIAGLDPGALVLGASFTAVVVGLAAQQTVGNVLAGIVLISAHPFRVGERVRFAGFGMDVEGIVATHGLLYLTLSEGEDLVLVPNATALTMSVRPLREPAAVDLRARLPLGVDPEAIERRISEGVTVLTRGAPHVALEELDGSEIVVRIRATPVVRSEGGRLARDVLEAVAALREEAAEAAPGRG
jgi:small conductance mechanosensitive channel